MKLKFALAFASILATGYASAQEGLYYTGDEAQSSLPLKWSIGLDAVYDNNVTPLSGTREDAFSINPYVGLSFVNITPQTTWDVYARLGAIYYFDQPDTATDDLFGQARLGVNLAHRFSERLRLSSRNFVAYELEPDYSYGFATSRQVGEYLYWQTDNALGYRWSERFATYTGVQLTGLDYDKEVSNQDRFIWSVYNQFRYQLQPQTVLTASYRYSQVDGDGAASDSENHYVLVGAEHRFSPNTILIVRAGAQFRDVDRGDSYTSPYAEVAVNTAVNEQFSVRAFARYSLEDFDTTRATSSGLYDFDQRKTFRVGVSGSYVFSERLTSFAGVDYIPASFEDGRSVVDGSSTGSQDEQIVNAYIGFSVKLTDYLYTTATYNFTAADSDFQNGDYDRSRFSLGVRAEF